MIQPGFPFNAYQVNVKQGSTTIFNNMVVYFCQHLARPFNAAQEGAFRNKNRNVLHLTKISKIIVAIKEDGFCAPRPAWVSRKPTMSLNAKSAKERIGKQRFKV